ncbi:MAG TPA: diaminopimelate epimerase, partial [Phycisphaerales bacterium]|nr:diaminopimelate epimerase [Phycisphaerales bacterium]
MPPIPFVKMHGIGNDYIYLDAVADPSLDTMDGLSELARSVSHRHTGIGADGLILVCNPTDAGRAEGAHVRMRMFNADGSESAVCGNGVRCVAKFAHDRLNYLVPSVTVETTAGLVAVALTLDALGRVDTASVDMGEPVLDAARIPVVPKRGGNADGRAIDLPAEQLGVFHTDVGFLPSAVGKTMTCLSMGNPHVVLWCNDPWDIPLEVVGPLIETDPMFPSRVNVHFAAPSGKKKVVVRTWERGSGITQACGTGACAVVVAGALTGRLARSACVALPGGELDIEWDETSNRVR